MSLNQGIVTLAKSEKNHPVSAREIMTDTVHILAFGFGSGLAPKAPGTFGSVIGALIAWAMLSLGPANYLIITILSFVFGVWLCGASSTKLGVHDHGGIVWDEIVGMMITYFMLPQGWWWLLLGFVLFRLFDIVKPWPISWLDKRVHGGFGIMIDDVIAGLFALAVLQLLSRFL